MLYLCKTISKEKNAMKWPYCKFFFAETWER